LIVTVLLIFNKRGGNKRDANAERKPFFIKPDRYLLILGLISFCTMMCEGTVFDWGVNYFEKVVKADRHLVTAGYTAFLATMTLGRLIGDKIIAYLGLQKVLMVNGLCMAAGFLIVVIFPSVWSAAFGFLLIGLGDSIIIPTLYSLAGKSARMKPAYAIASVSMIGYIGFLAAPLIVGSLSEAWGMSSAFVLMSVLSFFIFVFTVVLGRTHNG
jgi:fucose permease